jgi:tetratricopeptide (TPR) repeat protein
MIKSVEKVVEKKIVMEEKEIVGPRKKITNEELIRNNLSNNFYRGNYQKALDTFLPILGKSDITVTEMAMGHFYMGQCYFYLGNYKNAVKYFILSKELQQFKNRSEVWIDRCLERIDG